MGDRKGELVAAWMAKATSDLETARLLIREKRRLLDVAVYHCQQAAEKAIKAWLTEHDIIFPKTHSLEDLVELCTPSAPVFEQIVKQAAELTPFGFEFRYPGQWSVVSSQ